MFFGSLVSIGLLFLILLCFHLKNHFRNYKCNVYVKIHGTIIKYKENMLAVKVLAPRENHCSFFGVCIFSCLHFNILTCSVEVVTIFIIICQYFKSIRI